MQACPPVFAGPSGVRGVGRDRRQFRYPDGERTVRIDRRDDPPRDQPSGASAGAETTTWDDGLCRSVFPGGFALDRPEGPPKILIADDNVQNVELLEAY